MAWPKGKPRPDAFKRREHAVATKSEVQPTEEGKEEISQKGEEEVDAIWMPPYVDINSMSKQDCSTFSMRHFGTRLDNSKLVHEMRQDIQRLLSTRQHQRYM